MSTPAKKLIFQTCLTKVMKVDATSCLSILLLYRYDIGKPRRVLDGFYETDIQELLYFLFDLHLELHPEVPWRLFHWLDSFLDIEFVRDKLLIKPRHLGIGASNVFKFLQ